MSDNTSTEEKKTEGVNDKEAELTIAAIESVYHKARLLFCIAIGIGIIGIGLALCNRYHVVDMFTMPETPASAVARMPKYDFPLLHQEWKDYLAMPERARRLCMRDQSFRNILCARAWKCPNPDNQFIGKEYEQWITDDIAPRVLNVPKIVNVRDMGGWKVGNGKRIRQGLIIRSGELNGKSYYNTPGRNFLDIRGQQILVKQLGIKTDIDLRWDSEVQGMTRSPIGPEVNWKHHSWSLYQWIGNAPERETFFNIFRDLIDRNNLPALVHCVYGRDRTGTLCFILEGILGVSDNDKLKDWEASAFWFNDMSFTHQKGIDGLIQWLNETYATGSINGDCVAYAKSCGLTDNDIALFRTIMLEDDSQ